MKIAIIHSESSKKSCALLSEKIKSEVQLIPIKKAKSECLLKYSFIILAGSDSDIKRYVSRNLKTLHGMPTGLIINTDENKNIKKELVKVFPQSLVDSSAIYSNFGYELNPDKGNYFERKKTNKKIKEGNIPSLNIKEIENFANYINEMIDKRVD